MVKFAFSPFIFVQDEASFDASIKALLGRSAYAFDAEGVNLGRSPGSLTVATIVSLDDPLIHVFDVQVLGAEKVFSRKDPSLAQILEGDAPIVTFDCRSDSDALFHHFGVRICNVRDVQVLDQAARIFNGELPPNRCNYLVRVSVPRLAGMDDVAKRLEAALPSTLAAPHMLDSKAWEKRPLKADAIEYAAKDVQIIREMHNKAWMMIREKLVSLKSKHGGNHASPWEAFWSLLEDAYVERSMQYVLCSETVLCTQDPLLIHFPLLIVISSLKSTPLLTKGVCQRTTQGVWANSVCALARKNGVEWFAC